MSPPETKAISERSGDMAGSAKLGIASAAAGLEAPKPALEVVTSGVSASDTERAETNSQLRWSIGTPLRLANFEVRISICGFRLSNCGSRIVIRNCESRNSQFEIRNSKFPHFLFSTLANASRRPIVLLNTSFPDAEEGSTQK